MKYKIAILATCLLIGALQAQNPVSFTRNLQWAAEPQRVTTAGGQALEIWTFDEANRMDRAAGLPVFMERFPLNGPAELDVTLSGVQWEFFAKTAAPEDSLLTENIVLRSTTEQERERWYGRVRFIPIRRTGSGYERATAFTVNVTTRPVPVAAQSRTGPFADNSVLRNGAIAKFGVSNSGIYRLDYNFLKNDLGIANIDNIDPRTFKLYGNGGQMLPERAGDARPDDLTENAIFISGEADGRFNTGDFILFYAVGPTPTLVRDLATDPELHIETHLYDRHAWYFIKTGEGGNGLRVADQPSLTNATATTEQFDDVRRIEEEKINLLNSFGSAQGSGKRWFGDLFRSGRKTTEDFEFPNIVTGISADFRALFAGRSNVTTSVRFTAGTAVFTRNIGGVNISNNESAYAREARIASTFTPTVDKFQVVTEYLASSPESEGWLDFIEIQARRRLTMAGTSMVFRDLQTLANNSTLFRLGGTAAGTAVWDITNPQRPGRQQVNASGGTLEFGAATRGIARTFIAFVENTTFPKPERAVKQIDNQNLHALTNLDMVIVYPAEFEAAAQRLADHRRRFSGLTVASVRIDQVFNEFSSGAKDPTAIRDFAKMLYERNPRFNYLLLFGDGSFDPKNNSKGDNNLDFIPVFETEESFEPVEAFPSDDYFGLLSDKEGGELTGSLDIAVGRITPRSLTEADAIVDKIVAYDSSSETLGDWRQRLMFIADDEDGNAHINQADKLSGEALATEDWFNSEKIYLDAYQQVATSGGQRYPDAKAAINANIFKGALMVQYIGHGGPRGWAQERLIDNSDIANWENPNRYPLLITATCSFGGYDDYTNLTGGEQALIKPRSGAIALYTTTRAVYIDGNERLTDAVQDNIFKRVNGQYRTIGNILNISKNTLTSFNENNGRRFTLLGDPAMYLALPKMRVQTDSVNGKVFDITRPDTLRALSRASVAGSVTDTLGRLLSDYNGRVFITIFDKKQVLRTLGQDPGSPVRTFDVQRNAVFRGVATVRNGRFRISFVVPKDINYTFGRGKVSYYAENGTTLDAAGADDAFVIGGAANDIKDNTPPLVQVFMNTADFAFGGMTDDNPKIFVQCADDFGMNVSGTSLGHDLTAILDDKVQETIVLNDFYQSKQDDAAKGTALYPLRNLSTGRHTLRVKGWDIANNSGEGYTEFIVSEDGKAALEQVLNYPNPFTTNTTFQFGHNLAGQQLDVQITIFSVSGKVVKTIQHSAPSEGYRVSDIPWDGKDEYGDRLGKGVYLYRVKVRGTDNGGQDSTVESKFEKLVILR